MIVEKREMNMQKIGEKHSIVSAAILCVLATPALGDTFIILPRPEPPRGKLGTFQALWMQRTAPHPKPGIASWYNDKLTATGERLRPYDAQNCTCSHPEASELGQRYIVKRGDKSIACLVNDIGPAKRLNRAIDLTPACFELLGFKLNEGLGLVTIERQ